MFAYVTSGYLAHNVLAMGLQLPERQENRGKLLRTPRRICQPRSAGKSTAAGLAKACGYNRLRFMTLDRNL